MKSILNMSLEHLSDKMYVNNIPCCEIKFLYDTEEVINDIMLGSMLLFQINFLMAFLIKI